jgi:hypothetical protein
MASLLETYRPLCRRFRFQSAGQDCSHRRILLRAEGWVIETTYEKCAVRSSALLFTVSKD